ncbi:Protein RDM1 [Capsicum baccatum]|uniref:Protein RDM1 n=1 Tax=Capsicum baccatum TaxID=33114 RepID=A0A2G2W077_CAPBA|nr:Protein RDM1 [Capsicum baccatum]
MKRVTGRRPGRRRTVGCFLDRFVEFGQIGAEIGRRNLLPPPLPYCWYRVPAVVCNADAILRRAKMYQEYMQMVPMPTEAHSLIPCNSWRGLAASIKTLYGQPLHYLTNLRMKEWDKMRIEADNEDDPLDMLIHPNNAESCIWHLEEVHRRTSSPSYLARLWVADPMYHVYIDAIFPKLQNPSK